MAAAIPRAIYRSIVGNLSVMSHQVIGVKLPPGVRGAPGVTIVPDHATFGVAGATRTTGTPTYTRLLRLPVR